jgi:hypothetical protein
MNTPPPLHPQYPQQAPQIIYQKPKTSPVTWFVLGLFGFMVICVIIGSSLSSGSSEPTAYGTYHRACTAIKATINDPESAIFSDEFYGQRNDGNFEVGGVLRARNGFGGMAREDWRMVVSPSGEMVYSKVGKVESGPYPQDTAPPR